MSYKQCKTSHADQLYCFQEMRHNSNQYKQSLERQCKITHFPKYIALTDVTMKKYAALLNHKWHWTPTQALLDKIQQDRVICSTSQTIHTEILSVFHTDAAMTVITASRKACNHINDIVPKTAFTSQETIAIIHYDNDLPPLPLYKSMSHHHQKQRQTCWHCQRPTTVVQMIQTFNTIILKLPNDKLVHI